MRWKEWIELGCRGWIEWGVGEDGGIGWDGDKWGEGRIVMDMIVTLRDEVEGVDRVGMQGMDRVGDG